MDNNKFKSLPKHRYSRFLQFNLIVFVQIKRDFIKIYEELTQNNNCKCIIRKFSSPDNRDNG